MNLIQIDNLLTDTLTFFEKNPDKWCRDALARGMPLKKTGKGRATTPDHRAARSWSLAGYMMKQNGTYDRCFDNAIFVLADNVRRKYWMKCPLSPFGTVCWLNDELGYEAVITMLKEIVGTNGNSSI